MQIGRKEEEEKETKWKLVWEQFAVYWLDSDTWAATDVNVSSLHGNHGSDLVNADVAQSNRRRVTCIFYHEYNFMHYSWRRSRVVGISIQTLQWKLKRFDSGKMNFRFNLFAVSVLALFFIANPANSTSSISINNNAYSNIVVAISPDVPNTWSETILKNIQVIYIN